MNRKFFFACSLLFLVCFSAGIFTEIVLPADRYSFSMELSSPAAGITEYLKDDMLTAAASVICAFSVILMPAVVLLTAGKVFSLGFSAAYMLSAAQESGTSILFAALLPRAVFKLPAYLALIVISFQTASFIRKNHQNLSALKGGLSSHLLHFLLCFIVLALSSILEVILLQAVL